MVSAGISKLGLTYLIFVLWVKINGSYYRDMLLPADVYWLLEFLLLLPVNAACYAFRCVCLSVPVSLCVCLSCSSSNFSKI